MDIGKANLQQMAETIARDLRAAFKGAQQVSRRWLLRQPHQLLVLWHTLGAPAHVQCPARTTQGRRPALRYTPPSTYEDSPCQGTH